MLFWSSNKKKKKTTIPWFVFLGTNCFNLFTYEGSRKSTCSWLGIADFYHWSSSKYPQKTHNCRLPQPLVPRNGHSGWEKSIPLKKSGYHQELPCTCLTWDTPQKTTVHFFPQMARNPIVDLANPPLFNQYLASLQLVLEFKPILRYTKVIRLFGMNMGNCLINVNLLIMNPPISVLEKDRHSKHNGNELV